MIEILSKHNRLIGFEARRLRSKLNKSELLLYNKVDKYFYAYCIFYNITVEVASNTIDKFIYKYKKDLQNFQNTDKFPYELNQEAFELSRIEYDLFLISSILFTPHRFQIIWELNAIKFSNKNISIIGVGSGLELLFLSTKTNNITAYDLKTSDFAKSYFKDVVFKEELFIGESENNDIVIAIELLEHLHNPIDFIKKVYFSLKEKGQFITTTIKNVPQFDHLINFSNKKEFENEIESIGFKVIKDITIPHFYRFSRINANNTFYMMSKNDI